MNAEIEPTKKDKGQVTINSQSSGDAVYGFGLIGAWVYYIGRAKTFPEGVKGFFKAFVWPAILVYELLKFFNKE